MDGRKRQDYFWLRIAIAGHFFFLSFIVAANRFLIKLLPRSAGSPAKHPPEPNFLIQNSMHLCMNGERRRERGGEWKWKMNQCERSQTVLVGPSRRAVAQWAIIAPMIVFVSGVYKKITKLGVLFFKSSSILAGGSCFLGSSRKVIPQLATIPAPAVCWLTDKPQ